MLRNIYSFEEIDKLLSVLCISRSDLGNYIGVSRQNIWNTLHSNYNSEAAARRWKVLFTYILHNYILTNYVIDATNTDFESLLELISQKESKERRLIAKETFSLTNT